MSEVAICQARANVMTYDDTNKKWIPSGSSPGLSKVQIYQHTVNSTFRVVGRKLQDHEVVINCAILKNLKYNQATQTFHQWRDSRHVYGLNFANKEDSEVFANSMMTALDTLNNQGRPMPPPNPPPTGPPGIQQQYAETQQNGPQQQISEDNRSSRPDFIGHRRYPSGGAPAPYNMPQVPQEPAFQPPQPAPAPSAIPAPPGPPPATPAPPPAPPGAPAAPPVPPAPPACGPPPAPPPPGVGGGAPPAPPPPPMGGNSPEQEAPTSLAAGIRAVQLNKLKKVEADGEGGASPSNRPPKGGGPVDHMSELQKTLLKRINKDTQVDQTSKNLTPSQPPVQNRDSVPSRQWEVSNGTKHTNGTGSPQPKRSPALHRRNHSITEQEHTTRPADANAINNSELEALKQDILTEMRKDMNKMKQEILEAIRDSSR